VTVEAPLVLPAAALPHNGVNFAHNSERQFAKLLDFYGIEWEYETHTFVLERNARGDPTHAFSPDFYLPAYDLFVEITTLKQTLVTKKNRKVRRLLELHPEIQVKILYQRDYLNLLVKYGLESPDQLSGYCPHATAGESAESLLGLGTYVVRGSRPNSKAS
jgi:bifunctional protein TilS/HprT